MVCHIQLYPIIVNTFFTSVSSSLGILLPTLPRDSVIRRKRECSQCSPCRLIRTAAWAVPWAVREVNDIVDGEEKHTEWALRKVQHYQSTPNPYSHSRAI